MKKVLILIFLLATIMFLISSCTKQEQTSSQNLDSCTSTGGFWKNIGHPSPICVHNYTGGGKPCNSSYDCEGNCIVYNENDTPFCEYDDNPIGRCYSSIERLKDGYGILCVD